MAARVATALESRLALPMAFTEEVMKKIQEISADGESVSREHENHELFSKDHDEQLLLWLNRYEESIIIIPVRINHHTSMNQLSYPCMGQTASYLAGGMDF